jgi:D-alanyl-lipoteichoic acid acyltransferase DltB (MBOAT superfamily)
MLFNSFHFIVFFPLVIAFYFILHDKWRWLMLLIASYYFYMCWKPEYATVLMGITLLDYFLAIQIDRSANPRLKKQMLILSLISNLGLLFIFKYFNFFNDNIREVLNKINIYYDSPVFSLILPIGLSFHTFQSLSYTIDVYYGKIKPTMHFGKYALFVSFFPQLVAGPIERATNLLPQFFVNHKFNSKNFTDGLKLLTWGFFKKLVIADRLALFSDSLFSPPIHHYGFAVIIGVIFFAIQIYCDFSGYTDIAIGTARIMGYHFTVNFNRPYFSASFSEFWRRWHISLSSWFRDYLYIPLGGNRAVKWRWYYNIIITFLVSGIWHGANWTFLIWGLLHGIFLIMAEITRNSRKIIYNKLKLDGTIFLKIIHVLIVFSFVCVAWIFFRAQTVNDAFQILKNVSNLSLTQIGLYMLNGKWEEFALSLIFIPFLFFVDFSFENYKKFHSLFAKEWLKWTFYIIIIFFTIFFGKMNAKEFIYFQF